ncbi:MAG: hypothetical protein ACK5MD_01795 [Flavobacteriales bacterium]
MKNVSFIILVLLFSVVIFAQNREILQGHIEVDLKEESPEGIEVTNLNTSRKIITDSLGHFKISAQLNDILYISSYNFEKRWYIITTKNLQTKYVVIHLNIEPNIIEEVVVNQLKFTGNLAKDVKNNRSQLTSYKQQQTIAKVKPTDLSTGQLTPVNISKGYRSKFKSKTASQKKRIAALSYRGEVETQLQIQHYFDEDFYINTLHIPKEEIQNFITYCYFKSDLKSLVKTNQFAKIQLKLIDLAPQYIASMKNTTNDQSIQHLSLIPNLS